MLKESSMAAPETTRPPRRIPSPRDAWRHAKRLYDGINHFDRQGGGGVGFSSLVKLAGWAGLLAVLAVLVVKVRHIQADLDPVAHGVERLHDELNVARSALRDQSNRSRSELSQLAEQADHLREEITHQAEIDARAGKVVTVADREAQELVAKLRDDLARADALIDAQSKLQGAVSTFGASVERQRQGFESAGTKLAAASQALGDSLTRSQQRAASLEKDVGGVSLASTRAALSKVDSDAKALSDALEKSTRDALALDALLQQRGDALREQISREQVASAVDKKPAAALPTLTSASAPAH